MNRVIVTLILVFFVWNNSFAQQNGASSRFKIARLKYNGGGDWYNDPSCIPNMLEFLKRQTNIDVGEEARVSILDEDFFSYPFIFMTGHGRVSFSEKEASRLRLFLEHGGFLFVDDDYGLDKFFRLEMSKVFPDKKLTPVPFSHTLFHNHFNFSDGLPKIHEHDGGPPEGYAYFHNGRMVLFYSYNTNISDGWVDADVHGDPPHVREKALQMGTNIIIQAMTQ